MRGRLARAMRTGKGTGKGDREGDGTEKAGHKPLTISLHPILAALGSTVTSDNGSGTEDSMASGAHGSTRTVRWSCGTEALPPVLAPLFGDNDNGDIDYRAVHAAARRLWAVHGGHAPLVAAARAQSAFWQGKMTACRWWHSVARMIDRALVAGDVTARCSADGAIAPPEHVAVNI
jgi:hypothetical protein